MSEAKFDKAVAIIGALPKEGAIKPTQEDQLYVCLFFSLSWSSGGTYNTLVLQVLQARFAIWSESVNHLAHDAQRKLAIIPLYGPVDSLTSLERRNGVFLLMLKYASTWSFEKGCMVRGQRNFQGNRMETIRRQAVGGEVSILSLHSAYNNVSP